MPLWGKAAAGTQAQKPKWVGTTEAVSYTHLTLPTTPYV